VAPGDRQPPSFEVRPHALFQLARAIFALNSIGRGRNVDPVTVKRRRSTLVQIESPSRRPARDQHDAAAVGQGVSSRGT